MNGVRRASGFSLIELIVFIVVVSVGLAGVMLAFTTAARGNADPMVRKQALLIAEGMMAEIMQKSFQNDSTGPNGTTPALGCTPTTTPRCTLNSQTDRPNYNDVDDYDTFSQTGVMAMDGTTSIAGLESYTVTVSVTGATLGNNAYQIDNTKAKRISVTVIGGGNSVTLIGYRANYD